MQPASGPFASKPRKKNIAHLNRWIGHHVNAASPSPDFVWHMAPGLRIAYFKLLREVPLVIEKENVVGKRLSELVDQRLAHQFAEAAQRAVGERAPVDIQFTSHISGRHWLSTARLFAHPKEKLIVVEVSRSAAAVHRRTG